MIARAGAAAAQRPYTRGHVLRSVVRRRNRLNGLAVANGRCRRRMTQQKSDGAITRGPYIELGRAIRDYLAVNSMK